jgi:hypothetical protein
MSKKTLKHKSAQPAEQQKGLSLLDWAIAKHTEWQCPGRCFPIVHRPWMQVIQ